MPFRFALPTRCFSGPLKTTLRTFAEQEIRGAQFDVGRELRPGELSESGLRQFRHLLADHNVEPASCAVPLTKSLSDEDGLDRRIDAIRAGMALAFSIGTDILTARTGALPDPEAQPKEWKLLVDVLNDLAAYGNHVGTTLHLTIAPRSAELLQRFFDSITAGPLGLNFDPVACLTAGQSSEAIFRAFHERIGHVRARDAAQDIEGGLEETALGQGEVDWTTLLALLHEADYSGWITLDRLSGDNKPRDLLRGVKYLQGLLPF
jgi:sugar phosphate isomerase/epimerase